MIQRKVMLDISPTPHELAFEFANMDDERQAYFFNELARITAEWEGPFCFQLQSLIDNQALNSEGRQIMERIGEYGKP